MGVNKELKSLGMPWEEGFAYSQAVKVGDTIYLSGQISHDENGDTVGVGDMEAQMRRCYANIGTLAPAEQFPDQKASRKAGLLSS